MRLEIGRYSMQIYPDQHNESQREIDTAYIEEVLGLKEEGDTAIITRKNAMNLYCLAYLEIKKTPSATA